MWMMKKIILLCIVQAMLLTGCKAGAAASGQSPEPSAATIFSMDTVMEVTAYGAGDGLMKKVSSRIKELDAALSTTDRASEVFAINALGSGKVSDDTLRLVKYGISFGEMTGGLLDVTIYPLVREWGFTTGNYKVPDKSVITELIKKVDYRNIRFDEEASTVSIPEGAMIDFGSLAKGYTGDVLLKMLEENGISSAMVNLGGNVQTLGTKPDGTEWKIGIESPGRDGYIGIVPVADKAVITSGGYERYFKGTDGNIYWHIFDPRTGYPAKNGLISVSIVTDTGIYGEALSTSLFVMGLEAASEFWRSHRDFEAVFIMESGEIFITGGLENRFKVAGTSAGGGLSVIRP
ncbi:thiamine biosynthesis lipoprotein ApbE precursor [Ruminiclostridium hungatei]|uniref:FAD:protein FMN transferase n=2 Tax=Ruminiclostridium hungatei TaxID=48256 RepID=A0A1V4SPN6_RUMHU|nr:thiamine biosynthesis lipoprotein ApbE precursor [Ruminiclostridium hungatei]